MWALTEVSNFNEGGKVLGSGVAGQRLSRYLEGGAKSVPYSCVCIGRSTLQFYHEAQVILHVGYKDMFLETESKTNDKCPASIHKQIHPDL